MKGNPSFQQLASAECSALSVVKIQEEKGMELHLVQKVFEAYGREFSGFSIGCVYVDTVQGRWKRDFQSLTCRGYIVVVLFVVCYIL